jgi:hypothetical protein
MKTHMPRMIALSVVLGALFVSGLACSAPEESGPPDKTWVSPGKVRITNLAPGGTARGSITIHNGSDTEAGFSVYYRIPDYTQEGFASAPAEARGWVTPVDIAPVLSPNETKEIEVVLRLPKDATNPERWEFWIGVKADSGGSLATELCSRWLISMRGH